MTILFPHNEIRPVQKDLINEIDKAISTKSNLIVHAPTGLGKTAASLAPTIEHAKKNKLTVFFLTSRHTQHKIAIDTVQLIRDKHNIEINVVDIVGKKWMCAVPGVNVLNSSEFNEYCKNQRENSLCEFYTNCRSGTKVQPKAQKVIKDLKQNVKSSKEIVEIGTYEKLCPYELNIELAKDADVIIADYFYIYNEKIRNNFFNKIDKELGSCLIIVDEGHNLPNRVRSLMSSKLSDFVIDLAIKETKKHGFNETNNNLNSLLKIILDYEAQLKENDEILIEKEDFINKINTIKSYEEFIQDLYYIADEILEKQKRSFSFSIALFLETWLGDNRGFARIFSRNFAKSRPILNLSYQCLDPSLVTRSVNENSHSTILMSGTLTPTSMYNDLLGFNNTTQKIFESPFPKDNKLSLIIPKTTTKYTSRNETMYKEIANICSEITNIVNGNSAIFFPSYYLRDKVYEHFFTLSKKTNFKEDSSLSKDEKQELLERFKLYKKAGAVLLGVSSGSYGEGIDLPGDLLKCVVVVGLPLQKPDLETKELIKYYDTLFNKGWDYGYLFPAFNKTLQSAGRCIRSETDKGIVIYLDERYAWKNYYRCFPNDSGIIVAKEYEKLITNFIN